MPLLWTTNNGCATRDAAKDICFGYASLWIFGLRRGQNIQPDSASEYDAQIAYETEAAKSDPVAAEASIYRSQTATFRTVFAAIRSPLCSMSPGVYLIKLITGPKAAHFTALKVERGKALLYFEPFEGLHSLAKMSEVVAKVSTQCVRDGRPLVRLVQ